MTSNFKKELVSHLEERNDKTCLNCGNIVMGRYCQDCGQENVEPKETFWQLIVHFFNDITHFDGKFFKTLKLLILKPGFLTGEYVAGRRASYLNPIRMYLFISFIVFLVLFSIPKRAPSTEDLSATRDTVSRVADSTEPTRIIIGNRDTARSDTFARVGDVNFTSRTGTISDTTVEQYIKRQQSLPENERDNAVQSYFVRKVLMVNEYGRKNRDTFGKEIFRQFKHSVPQMFFVSIPIFAFLLYLLYIRRRQAFYYVSHGIFSIHFYCAAYVFFLVFSLVGWIAGMIGLMQAFATLATLIYLFIAMRRFYQQGVFKTFIKYSILTFVMSILLTILTILFLINSILKLPSLH